MSDPRILYIGNKNYSSWSLRPWLYLKMAQLSFEEVRIPIYIDGYREILEDLSPSGKVPVFKDGDLLIWDSLAICEYIAEQYPDSRGWPQDVAARARARAVSAEMHSLFSALRNQMPMNCRTIHPPGTLPIEGKLAKDVNRVKAIWSDSRKNFGTGGPFLFGEFSIADAMFSPVAFRFQSYQVPLDPIQQAYCQALLDLPAMREWAEASALEAETIDFTKIPV